MKRQTDRQRQTERKRQTDRDEETDRQRQTEMKRQTDRQRQAEMKRQTGRQTDRSQGGVVRSNYKRFKMDVVIFADITTSAASWSVWKGDDSSTSSHEKPWRECVRSDTTPSEERASPSL